jgi:hypothetical protein
MIIIKVLVFEFRRMRVSWVIDSYLLDCLKLADAQELFNILL